MFAYLCRRLLLIIPTLLGILTLNFAIIQMAPGGPVEQMIAKLQNHGGDATDRASGNTRGQDLQAPAAIGESSGYRGAQGLDPEIIKEIEKDFGFDKPPIARYFIMLGQYLQFDFGKSYFRSVSVAQLIAEKMPVSISLGVWTTLIVYLVSIPLGIRKAVRHGEAFDVWSSFLIIVFHAIPAFLLAVLLIVVFAGGEFFSWFPLRGLVSDNWHDLSWSARIADYFWHMALPILAMVLGGFASLTMLTKNSFLDELGKQYVLTARAKGAGENRVLYGHVFRNAMLLVIAGFPQALIGMLFTGALLIEVIFSLDGLGLLGFESAMNRDYPVVFGTLYVFTLIGLLLNLISDMVYMWVDPRIDLSQQS